MWQLEQKLKVAEEEVEEWKQLAEEEASAGEESKGEAGEHLKQKQELERRLGEAEQKLADCQGTSNELLSRAELAAAELDDANKAQAEIRQALTAKTNAADEAAAQAAVLQKEVAKAKTDQQRQLEQVNAHSNRRVRVCIASALLSVNNAPDFWLVCTVWDHL